VELKARDSNYHQNILHFLKNIKPPWGKVGAERLHCQNPQKPLNSRYAYTATTGTWTLAHIDTFTLHSITLSFTFFIIHWHTLTNVDSKLVKHVELEHEICAYEIYISNYNRNNYDECRWAVGGTSDMTSKHIICWEYVQNRWKCILSHTVCSFLSPWLPSLCVIIESVETKFMQKIEYVELGHETCASERSRSNYNRNPYGERRWAVGGTWSMIQKRLGFENTCKIYENTYFRIQSVHLCRRGYHHFE